MFNDNKKVGVACGAAKKFSLSNFKAIFLKFLLTFFVTLVNIKKSLTTFLWLKIRWKFSYKKRFRIKKFSQLNLNFCNEIFNNFSRFFTFKRWKMSTKISSTQKVLWKIGNFGICKNCDGTWKLLHEIPGIIDAKWFGDWRARSELLKFTKICSSFFFFSPAWIYFSAHNSLRKFLNFNFMEIQS